MINIVGVLVAEHLLVDTWQHAPPPTFLFLLFTLLYSTKTDCVKYVAKLSYSSIFATCIHKVTLSGNTAGFGRQFGSVIVI